MRSLAVDTITVIVPTHNRSKLLHRALASVRAQTHLPLEVIVVDDGSTDGTHRWVPEFSPGIKYLRQPQRGVSAARNHGLLEAAGEWIAFLDSDDEWRTNKLERQLTALRESPEHMICHTDEIWIRRGRRVNPRERHAKAGGHIFQQCLPLCAISPSSVLLRRELLDEVGGFDETLPACEDYDLWLRICCRYPVLFVDEPLVIKYGGHDDQLSAKYWGMDRFRIRALEKVLSGASLLPEDRRAAVRTLLGKIDVYVQGARKRNKQDEVANYEAKRGHYEGIARELARCESNPERSSVWPRSTG